MILKALYDYYERRKNDFTEPGFEDKDFKFVIVIEKDGRFSHLEDLRSGKGGKSGKTFRVPQEVMRTVKITPNLLWDNYGYVLAQPKASKKKDPAERAKEEEKNLKNAKKQNEAFVANLRNLPERLREDEGVRAVLLFYEKGEMERVKNEEENPLWDACRKVPGCNLTFQLKGETLPVPCHRAVVDYVSATCQDEPEEDENEGGVGMPGRIGICSATGRKGPLARLMLRTPIPGGRSNAALVAVQKSSGYDSYGKEQLFNASLGKETVEACTIALKALLDKDSRNRFGFGPLTVLFWVEKAVSSFDFEAALPLLAQKNKENATNNTTPMLKMCEAVHKGALPPEDRKIRYYFLGLAPNAARIMVRFWKTGTVGELAENIAQHFDDLRIIGRDKDFALVSLLSVLVHENKMDNVPPNLPEQMLAAILDGRPYPMTILNLCLQRIHAGREKKESGKGSLVTPLRAAILKAYLNRKERNRNPNRKETIGMSYDPNYKNEAYQCGALFAVLEKAQEEASGGEVNATIGDRYYGAASTAPGSVFGALLKLNRAHLTKLRKNKPGRHTQFVKWIGELMQLWDKGFPRHLSPEDQGRFAIGYYQRRQEFFQKQDDSRNDESQDAQPELSLH